MIYTEAIKTPPTGWGRTNNPQHLLAAAAQVQAVKNCLKPEVIYNAAKRNSLDHKQLRKMNHNQIMNLVFEER